MFTALIRTHRMWGHRNATRRTVIKAGLGAAGAAVVGGLASRPASAQQTVTGGGDELQAAIDAAQQGDTLVVADSLEYDPITVPVGVTIEASGDPTIVGAGGITSAVSIEADGVTIRGFTITNEGGLTGVKLEPADRAAGRGRSDVTVADNVIEDLGSTEFLGVSGVVVGNGDHENVRIVNNTIRRVKNEIGERSRFNPTVNGVLFDAGGPGERVTDATVANNTIRDLTSDVAAIGLTLQHDLTDVAVANNEIAGITVSPATDGNPDDDGQPQPAVFAQGINVGLPNGPSTTRGVPVTSNRIEDVSVSAPDGEVTAFFPESVKVGPGTDVGGLRFRANSLLTVVGVNNAAEGTVDARNNYWGSSAGPEVADTNLDASPGGGSDVVGPVRFRPFQPNDPNRGGGRPDDPGRGPPDDPGRGRGDGRGRGRSRRR